jgi:hypothetical protein
MQPNFYRDAYIAFQDYNKNPVKAPEKGNFFEEFSKDLILMDWMIKGVKKDEYGNIIRQNSKFRGLAENALLNFVDIKDANDDIFNQPEWLLRKKHLAVQTAGDYLPPKNLLDYEGNEVSDEVKIQLADRFLDLNGKTIREEYDILNDIEDDETYKKAINYIRSYAIDLAKYELGIEEDEPQFRLERYLRKNTKD